MASDAKDHAAQLFRKPLTPEILDGDEIREYENDIYSVLEGENCDWADLLPYIDAWEEELGIDLSDMRGYVKNMADPDKLETVESKEVEDSIPKSEKFVIEKQVKESESDEMLAYTDEPIDIKAINQLQENIWLGEAKNCFLISKQKEWDGRVAGELSETKNKYELMAAYKDESSYKFKHFGQPNPNKGLNKVDSFSKSFFEYKFVADNKNYMVLSTEKLDPVRCKLYGTHVSLNDYKTVGENRKLPVEEDIIFVHSVEPAIEPLSYQEMENMQDKVGHEWLAERMYGVYRHPSWFEEFDIATDMVNEDIDNYPMHKLIMAPPDSGTSTWIEAKLESYDEPEKEPFDGGASTVKGLTPSFSSDPPNEGLLLKSQRVAAVDEFFDLLKNSIESQNANRQDAFTSLKRLLEHKKSSFRSGNGNIKGKMGSQMLAVTNGVYGIDNLIDAQNDLNPAVLSRFVQYQQLDSHIKFIRERKDELGVGYEEGLPERDDQFISLMDTVRDVVRVDVDGSRVGDIKNELKPMVPAGFKDTFDRRHKHHIKVTVAGLAKLNYFRENRDSFEVKDSDYERARELWEILISSWGEIPEGEKKEMSTKARKEALTHAQRQVYEVIDENYGLTGPELSEKTDVDSLAWCLTELKKLDLVAVAEDKAGEQHYYPHWHDKAQEE